MILEEADWRDLKRARMLLENPGIAAKITNALGMPIEKGFRLLPRDWKEKVGEITQAALHKAVHAAANTMKDIPGEESSEMLHKIAVAATGGIGGFFGLPALAVELPVSTAIMLRSIADIARSEGECISDIDSRMACLEVFALGGTSRRDDASETGYFAVRAALAQSVTDAARHIAERGLAGKGSPALLRLVVQISERFGIQVSQKAAAQAVPAIGAAGGALINTLFIDHFQDRARGHFIVRRLERKYGTETVKTAFNSL